MYTLETGLGQGCLVGVIDLELGTVLGSTNVIPEKWYFRALIMKKRQKHGEEDYLASSG